ncbi:hypothetical protein H4582DRAFT_2065258 [Lactarius indigo]|nr:hypothetical protein H4582DRAFT_2065258 [Lactarius indigo]
MLLNLLIEILLGAPFWLLLCSGVTVLPFFSWQLNLEDFVDQGYLLVAKVFLRVDLSLGTVCREIGLWRTWLFYIVVRMPVAPSSALGLDFGSGLGSVSTSAPAVPPTSAPAISPTSAPALPPASPAIPLAPAPLSGAAMHVTPPTSPQHSQHAAHQQEHDSHQMGSSKNCCTPVAPTLPRPPTLNGQEYHHLPANLAIQLAHIPPHPMPLRRCPCCLHGSAAASSMLPPAPPLLPPASISASVSAPIPAPAPALVPAAASGTSSVVAPIPSPFVAPPILPPAHIRNSLLLYFLLHTILLTLLRMFITLETLPFNALIARPFTDPIGKNFRLHIQNYNSALAMTSVERKLDEFINQRGGGPYTFRLHGELIHRAGSLLPPDGFREGVYKALE